MIQAAYGVFPRRVLQLRKRGISRVILAGMSANLCTQAHLCELLEQGFEVVVGRNATAAARLPEGDGYQAELVNFRYGRERPVDHRGNGGPHDGRLMDGAGAPRGEEAPALLNS